MFPQQLEWIKEGNFVDAKDKHGDWQVALVLIVNKTQVKIRFDGWPSKFDQVFPITTQKIKPFRSVIKGYTGQKRNPAVRQHWNFSIQSHQQKLTNFTDFVSHLMQKRAFQITQFLRGENYFYIDFLMTLTYKSRHQLTRVFDYFKAHIQFVKVYMKEIIQRDTNIWFQNQEKTQNLVQKAYSQIHYQIFDSIVSIVSSQARLHSFFKNNQTLLKQFIHPEPNYQNFITKQLINTNFFQTLEDLILKIFSQAQTGQRNIPYLFISSLIYLLNGFDKLPLPKQYKRKNFINIIRVIKQYFSSLSTTDVKINEKTIQQTLMLIRVLCCKQGAEKQELLRWTQTCKLKLWKLLIQCDVLQKKLRGINKIKQFYDNISVKTNNPLQNSSIMCTKQQFKTWLQTQEMYKILFQTNEHSQVVKKSCQMVQYFYASKVCTINQIVYIWQTCFNKHDAIKKIIFQQWIDLAQYVSSPNDWKLFIGVFIQNEQKINEDWQVECLLLFLNSIKIDEQNQSINSLIFMIYRKSLSKQKYINQFAKQLCFFQGKGDIVKIIIDRCIEMINQKIQAIFHLKLLGRIYSQMYNKQIYIPDNIIQTLINELSQLVHKQQNQKQSQQYLILQIKSCQLKIKILQHKFQELNQILNIFNKYGIYFIWHHQ